jgi:hypothetical protein
VNPQSSIWEVGDSRHHSYNPVRISPCDMWMVSKDCCKFLKTCKSFLIHAVLRAMLNFQMPDDAILNE